MAYSKEEHTNRKAKKKKTSLSDYFTSSVGKAPNRGGYRSMVPPMLSTIKLSPSESKNSYEDIIMTDQDNECNSVLDLEMMYGEELECNIPNIDKQDKECVKQILIDVIDLSLNEYSMHYILHSENEFMSPFQDLKKKVKDELFKFYKLSSESTPFKLWSELIDEHCKVMNTFLPISLQKELYEYRFHFVKKYTKNRVKFQLNEFTEKKDKNNKKRKGSGGVHIMDANSANHDPTIMTEEEWLEMQVADYINTPFHEFLKS